ncbi:MAG: DUF2505 family protein [Myxococcales bacterium]|nr:DUF2505 family protein [Myxococcales bacterium]MCB9643661.1 DUF2505 family protein [Myxococcales bacterium]
MRFEIQHTFPITREPFERDIFFSKDFQVFMDKDMSFGAREVLEFQEDDKTWFQHQRINADWELPSVVQKLVKQKTFYYFERSHFNKTTHHMTWSISTPLLTKLDVKGDLWIEEKGTETTRRVVGEINVPIFGVGGVVEKLIAQGIKDSYEKVSKCIHRWIREELPKQNPT